mmetsp:Transcript_22970/g.46787  ORF Transcript_22970/g.46787 Transcript_22970/m.46787 type:complete len:97 (+) Transcript_22970:77-367(+)
MTTITATFDTRWIVNSNNTAGTSHTTSNAVAPLRIRIRNIQTLRERLSRRGTRAHQEAATGTRATPKGSVPFLMPATIRSSTIKASAGEHQNGMGN